MEFMGVLILEVVEALINILKEPTVPIVLAGNYDSSDKMKKIKKVVKTLQISPLSPTISQIVSQYDPRKRKSKNQSW